MILEILAQKLQMILKNIGWNKIQFEGEPRTIGDCVHLYKSGNVQTVVFKTSVNIMEHIPPDAFDNIVSLNKSLVSVATDFSKRFKKKDIINGLCQVVSVGKGNNNYYTFEILFTIINK